MAVTDKEKASIKEEVYSDERAFRDALSNALKHDDIQKGVLHAWFKSATIRIIMMITVALSPIFVYAHPLILPFVQKALS